MERALLVALAGAIGTLTRYLVGVWAMKAFGPALPYGTFCVNVAGCFVISAVAYVAASTSLLSETMRITVMTGFVGGLTTYSSFNYETTRFLQARAWVEGFGYLGATLTTCFVSGLLGVAVARRVFGP